MSAEQTAPTRMNLLARRAQIRLASDGIVLLKGKREALLKELLARARKLRGLRNELHRRGRAAVASLAIARAAAGTRAAARKRAPVAAAPTPHGVTRSPRAHPACRRRPPPRHL